MLFDMEEAVAFMTLLLILAIVIAPILNSILVVCAVFTIRKLVEKWRAWR